MLKKRMFIALDISSADKVNIAQWREQHLDLQFKAVAAENFHITLAFLAFIDPQQQANIEQSINQQHTTIQQRFKALAQQKDALLDLPNTAPNAVPIVLSKIAYFKTAKVLHLTPTNCPDWLLDLNDTISQLCCRCNIPLQDRIYQPHLSLYRKAKLPELVNLAALQKNVIAQTVNITSFSLYHSYSTPSGVHYEAIKTCKLSSTTKKRNSSNGKYH
ncbi:2'-5' RNA ligase family protein [Colwellia sp. Arc7-635]|uniref:2'-5' RNA ligase family protein n=1 Tax=Colwellia sp. Arc7-635 TaxID=2497879 RepID=UPI0013E0E5B4|nr:2'-5' RNA ligase family protein [Colwellia sp. Arc7-635]